MLIKVIEGAVFLPFTTLAVYSYHKPLKACLSSLLFVFCKLWTILYAHEDYRRCCVFVRIAVTYSLAVYDSYSYHILGTYR